MRARSMVGASARALVPVRCARAVVPGAEGAGGQGPGAALAERRARRGSREAGGRGGGRDFVATET